MPLKRAVEKTIEYLEKYRSEISIAEIKERLISDRVYGDKEIEEKVSSIKYQVSSIKRKKNTKMNKVKELVRKYLSGFDDILMVGVTGSVAAGQPGKDDDIDLMIITSKDRLWLTRLRLRWLVWIKNIPHRKHGQIEHRDEFCFNLWMEDGALELPTNKQTLQNAMDLILMKPILNRKEVYQKFVLINRWAKKYVATGYSKLKVYKAMPAGRQVYKVYKEKHNCLWTLMNRVAFAGQYAFMKPKMKAEVVGLRWAFFHPVV